MTLYVKAFDYLLFKDPNIFHRVFWVSFIFKITITCWTFYARVKKPTITDTIRLTRLWWFGHVQRMEENRIPKKVLYMNLGTTRLRGRPRNRWQGEVREDGRIVGGEGWQEKVRNREEWKKLLRMVRNRQILHMPMEWMNVGHFCLNGWTNMQRDGTYKMVSTFERTACRHLRTV